MLVWPLGTHFNRNTAILMQKNDLENCGHFVSAWLCYGQTNTDSGSGSIWIHSHTNGSKRIPIVKMRWSHDCLIFMIKILVHGEESLWAQWGLQAMALCLIGETLCDNGELTMSFEAMYACFTAISIAKHIFFCEFFGAQSDHSQAIGYVLINRGQYIHFCEIGHLCCSFC